MLETEDEPTSARAGVVGKRKKSRKASGYIQKNRGDVGITPSMIEAGFAELCQSGLADVYSEADKRLVERIYLAMLEQRSLASLQQDK